MRNDYNGKKRSELPDEVFGIPQERKYPMPDEKHTRSAIKLFNHVEPKYEEQLAKAIIKNMKKYGIDESVVGPNNRLRKYLPKDMIKESMLLEGLLKSDKDIYYNKDKFDSGEINLCFITGLSGSGKSTMGRGMTSKNIEHYEMDDVICNDNFSDSNLKEYGGLIESFFKKSGKSFRLLRDDDSHNNDVFKSHKNYEKEITQAFVKHALSYCKSHKNTKFICDGIWVFMFINPSQLKDCAVYIKGTSSIKSGYRALKRDIDEDKRNGMTSLQIFKHEFKRVKEDILYAKENQKELKSFRSYFEKQSTNESVSSTVSKDHKQKGHIKLSSLKKVRITEYLIDKYKKEYPVLRHVRCKDTDEYVCDGYMWFKDDNLVCYVGSCQYTDDNTKWIVSLEILPEYRGYGLSTQILDFCVKSMKCKYLSVNKNNELAKKIYDKYGFKVYHEDKTMYYMTLDTISPKNESGGYIYSFERSPIQEYDYIPESGVLSVIKPIPTKDKNKIKYIMEDLGDDFKDFVFANICFYDIEECEKTPTGFVILRKKPELHTAFVSIGVLEQHRNSGVGSKLLQKAISYFKSTKDLMWLEYWVNIDNKASIALAEKSGFVEYLSGDTAKALGYYHYHMKNNNNLYERIEKSSSRKITTVVFDLGDVLIKSNMQNKLKKNPKIPNQQIYPLLEKWFDDDLDLLSKEEYIDTISKRLAPEFSDIVPDIVDAFSDIEVLSYTIPTLKDLKERGYNIYYLSNWSRWGVEILREKNKLDFLSLFDGGLFSYEVGVKKPDRKIYDAFLKKFKINPKEAIFVDNKKKNIDAAKKFGLRGVLFDKLDIGLVYNVLVESSDITTEKFIFGSKVKADMNKIAKEIVKTIKPIVLTSKNKQQASRIGLTLKCEVESLDHNTICILILDGSQDVRDSKDARLLLSNIQYRIGNELYPMVTKITMGDEDEGCLYFTINTRSVKNIGETYMNDNTLQEETRIEDNKLPKHIYHISYINHDGETFEPRTYDNDNVKNGMERKVKRVCFSDSITRALYSIFPNGAYDADFYVHVPNSDCKVYKTTSDDIYDADITHELWIKEPVQMKCIGKIHVNGVSDKTHTIDVDKDKAGYGKKKYHETRWNWVEKYEKDETLYESYISEDDDMIKEYIARDQSEYIQYTMESSISEYGTTAGAMVGSNQPDSVYIVSYMQNNAFSGYKEPKFGICKKGMKDLHVVGGKYNRFHYVSDLDKFKEEASDIHVYRFKGKPKNEFFDIIEEMKDDNDLDLYKLITGREIKDRSEIRFDGDFIEEECFFDTIDAIRACTEAGLLEASTDLHPVPILTETVQGRPYNYYRDLNGVFIQHEITGLRSKSYDTLDDIPDAETEIVKRGYLV